MWLQADRMSESPRRRLRTPFSVRTHVIGLILVVLLPLLAFGAFLVLRTAEHEQALLAAAKLWSMGDPQPIIGC